MSPALAVIAAWLVVVLVLGAAGVLVAVWLSTASDLRRAINDANAATQLADRLAAEVNAWKSAHRSAAKELTDVHRQLDEAAHQLDAFGIAGRPARSPHSPNNWVDRVDEIATAWAHEQTGDA